MKNILKKGFTLIEIIVVLTILAILAAVAIPTYLGYVDKTRESICENNIGILNRVAQAALLSDPALADKVKTDPLYFMQYVEDNNLASCVDCPSRGIYSAYYNESTKIITVVCSKHSSHISGKDFASISQDIYASTSYMSGSTLQERLAISYGGSLPQ